MTRLIIQLHLFMLFAFLLIGAAPCHAQHMNEKDSPCVNVVVTSDLVDCLSKARASSDAKLNSLYKSIRKRLEGNDTEAQRLWIKYRDANCSAERDLYDGGTAPAPRILAVSKL